MNKECNLLPGVCIAIFVTIIGAGCNPECGPAEPDLCEPLSTSADTVLITDFETGSDPSLACGTLSYWNDSASGIEVDVQYSNAGGGAWSSQYYSQVSLKGNDGDSPDGWSGGGLVFTFSNESEGIDLSNFKTLQFEIKTNPTSNLEEVKVKLQDNTGTNRPERQIKKYGITPTAQWQSVEISLEEFTQLKPGDPSFWEGLNIHHVTSFVTVSVNESSSFDMDGTLGIDNIRFVR